MQTGFSEHEGKEFLFVEGEELLLTDKLKTEIADAAATEPSERTEWQVSLITAMIEATKND